MLPSHWYPMLALIHIHAIIRRSRSPNTPSLPADVRCTLGACVCTDPQFSYNAPFNLTNMFSNATAEGTAVEGCLPIVPPPPPPPAPLQDGLQPAPLPPGPTGAPPPELPLPPPTQPRLLLARPATNLSARAVPVLSSFELNKAGLPVPPGFISPPPPHTRTPTPLVPPQSLVLMFACQALQIYSIHPKAFYIVAGV